MQDSGRFALEVSTQWTLQTDQRNKKGVRGWMKKYIDYTDENGERKRRFLHEENPICPPTWEMRRRWAFWNHVEATVLAIISTAGVVLLIIGTIAIIY